MLNGYLESPKHIKIAPTLPTFQFKNVPGGVHTTLPDPSKSSLFYIMHGQRGSPNTFSHNKQTLFELALGKIASPPLGIFSSPLD